MNKTALELLNQIIEMAQAQQDELYSLYHQNHQDKKAVGDTAVLHNLKNLKELVTKDPRPVNFIPVPESVWPTQNIPTENVPLEFQVGCCSNHCGCHE